jgi:hypothetical protein
MAALLAPGCAGAETDQPLGLPLATQPLPDDSPVALLGAMEINRQRLGFGSLSGLHLSPDLTLTTISDHARFATLRLSLDAALQPQGLATLSTGRLRDGSGQPLQRGHAGDSESLARLPDGTWLVGFERWHRIRAYRTLDAPGTYVEAPPGLDRAPTNGGLESLAVLEDGRWLAFAESLLAEGAPGAVTAWLGGPGRWTTLAYRPSPGFEPADAAPLSGGGALVLERSFSIFGGFHGRLVRIPAASLASPAPGTVLEGEELLRLAPPLPTDNWEGVAALRHQGRTLIALVSDDNENRLQRSLLMLLELREAP